MCACFRIVDYEEVTLGLKDPMRKPRPLNAPINILGEGSRVFLAGIVHAHVVVRVRYHAVDSLVGYLTKCVKNIAQNAVIDRDSFTFYRCRSAITGGDRRTIRRLFPHSDLPGSSHRRLPYGKFEEVVD